MGLAEEGMVQGAWEGVRGAGCMGVRGMSA